MNTPANTSLKSDSLRITALREWLASVLPSPIDSFKVASADASFRRYFRVTTQARQSYIVMDAPPEKEDCRPFLRVGQILHQLGVRIPIVHAQNLAQGFLLLDDLGNTSYLQALQPKTANSLYHDALDSLETMQTGRFPGPLELPRYDDTLLMNEMQLFPDWLVRRLLGVSLSPAEHEELATCFNLLTQSALEQPQVLVHRDYHSRNLMVLSRDNPGVIDFQDAVIGPITYDLVSLLRDCYIRWPQEQVKKWMDDYFARPAVAALLTATTTTERVRWFDWMGIQRHLKASGIFARLYLRDGKPGYLQDIPLTIDYIRQTSANYPQLAPLTQLLEHRLPASLIHRKIEITV